ncbi:MAG: hypothetical protein ACP5MZ_02910 [Candidatus Micrarchaeia archaeon]
MYGQNPQSGNAAQAPPPQAPAPQPNPTNAAKKGSKMAIYTIAAVVVVVIIAVALLALPKSQQSSNQLYSLISSNRNMPIRTFAQSVDSKFTNTSQLNISYSGLATVNAQSGGTNLTMKMPLKIDVMKYDSNARADVNVSDVPFVGNMTLVIILNNGEMYSCAKSALSSAFGLNSSSNSSGYQCQPPVQTSGLINSSTLNKLNGSIHFTSVKQSSYNGYGCVMTSGYMDINASALSSVSKLSAASSVLPTGTNVNASFSMCLSDTYYVPLTMSLSEVINSGSSSTSSLGISGNVNLQLNETSLSTSVSPSITTLPGPVVNSSTSSLP